MPGIGLPPNAALTAEPRSACHGNLIVDLPVPGSKLPCFIVPPTSRGAFENAPPVTRGLTGAMTTGRRELR